MKIYAYKTGSKSARALADALGIKIVKHEGKPIKIKGTLINWGSSGIEREIAQVDEILNPPGAIAKASNKLETFKAFGKGVPCPEWTESIVEASKWAAEGFMVVARKKLNGHSGEGIEIITADAVEVEAPLYTKYIKKDQEYRIHVFRGEVIFQQRKARKKEVPDEEVNWKVRNLAGGFIFANAGVDAGEKCKEAAVLAVQSLGLDFGAVDVLTTKQGGAFVLEVNTACGLEGSTIDAYVQKFKEFV